jgi:hypothetical protein
MICSMRRGATQVPRTTIRATPTRGCKMRPPNPICRPNCKKNRSPKLDPNSRKKLNLGLYFLRGPHQTHFIPTTLLSSLRTGPAVVADPRPPGHLRPPDRARGAASCSSSADNDLLLRRLCPRRAPSSTIDDGPMPVLGSQGRLGAGGGPTQRKTVSILAPCRYISAMSSTALTTNNDHCDGDLEEASDGQEPRARARHVGVLPTPTPPLIQETERCGEDLLQLQRD